MPNETVMMGLLNEAGQLTHQARAKMDEHKGGDLPADVKAQVDTWLETALAKKAEADEIKKDLDRERLVGSLSDQFSAPATPFAQPTPAASERREVAGAHERRAFHDFLLRGEIAPEFKALSVTADIEGGYLVPDQFRAEVIQKIEDMFVMRSICRVLPAIPSGASVIVPAADTEMEDASWSTEVATRDEDTTQPFAQRILRPNPLAKLVKVSNVLLRGSAVSIESWLRNELAKKHGRAEESAFMTGDGVGKPQGIFSSSVPSTVTDVTAVSATDIAADDLKKVVGNTRAQYRRNARWLMHRTILMELSLLKDGESRYLWQPSFVAGEPDRLLGYPVLESEFAPSSSATGLFVAAFADFEAAYWIQDAQGFTIVRLNELYAATRQTGFIGEKETDGQVCDGYALTRLKMA